MLHVVGPITITTDAAGAATSYTGIVTGKIYAIKFLFGTLDAGAGYTITGETSTLPILTIAGVGAANAIWYPRILPNKHTDGAAFTDVSDGPPVVFAERIKIVAASGGNIQEGTMTFYVEMDSVIGDSV